MRPDIVLSRLDRAVTVADTKYKVWGQTSSKGKANGIRALGASEVVVTEAPGLQGGVADLKPAAGQRLPVKPLMARTTPTPAQLLTAPTYAKPDRVDELVKRSQPRKVDPFDLPPPTGSAAPPEPAGTDPEPSTNETGPAVPQ